MSITCKSTGLLVFVMLITLGTIAQTTLIPFGATWKYLDNGSNQGTSWRSTSFDDGSWKSGPAELGYGDGDEATVVSFGSSSSNKYITTYFRRAVTIADASGYKDYKLSLVRDDGAVVYVNGNEVFRSNMPTGTIAYNTKASMSAKGGGYPPVSVTLPASAFVTGTNVVAVEVHQSSVTSSDLSFDLELIANPGTAPVDQTPPLVVSINRQSPASETTSATSVVFRATFSEAVTGVDAADFALRGSASGSIASVSGSSATWDVTVNNISGTGTLGLDLKSSGTGIEDAAANDIATGFTSGQTYTITTAQPVDFDVTRGPYLQVGSQTAMTLRWRTDVATDSRIDVGTTLGNYTLSEVNATVTREHEVRISGLTPGTKYYYRFGSSSDVLPGGSDYYFHTAPPASSNKKIRVAVFGDSGTNESAKENRERSINTYLNYTGDNPAELMLLLGDNAEPDGTDVDYQQNFFNYFDPLFLKNHVLFPQSGNNEYHEFGRESKAGAYYKIFSVPTQAQGGGVASNNPSFYSFNWGNIHFISLDSRVIESDGTSLSDVGGTQITWLEKDLAANNQKWTIVFFHHSPYTMGSHNSDVESALVEIRQNVLPILERYGVDMVITGHSHNYERSYLLDSYYGDEGDFSLSSDAKSSSSARYNNTSNSCPYVTESGTDHHGTVYVVTGAYYAIGTYQSSYPHAALPFTSRVGGVFYFEVEGNRLDAKLLRNDGAFGDQFTILKDANQTKTVNIAPGGSVILTASWIGTYEWSIGATSRSITVSPSSNTTYRVRDENGCLTDVFNVQVVNTNITTSVKARNEQKVALPVVYPTQVSRGMHVQVQTNMDRITEATLLDDKGVLLQSFKFNGSTYIDTKNLAAGMYFILLKDQDKVNTHKFIVTN